MQHVFLLLPLERQSRHTDWNEWIADSRADVRLTPKPCATRAAQVPKNANLHAMLGSRAVPEAPQRAQSELQMRVVCHLYPTN